jgi:hypothetical protein
MSVSLNSAFEDQLSFKYSFPTGTNLDKIQFKPIVMSREHKMMKIYAVYCFIKQNYQNSEYKINALMKTAQILVETDRFRSPLFNIANNIGGQKAFHNEAYFLKKDDSRDCIKGEFPYSRFIAYDGPRSSIEYGCGILLQQPRYRKALSYWNNPQRQIVEIHKAGYAMDPKYSRKIIGVFNEVLEAIVFFNQAKKPQA